MLSFVKSVIRKTPFYLVLRQRADTTAFFRLDEDDEKRLEFYSNFIRTGDTVFDVGANMGNRTKIFLALGANVVAFEPQRACADYLVYVLGSRRQFTLVRKALSDQEGCSEMLVSNVHVLSSLSSRWVESVKSSGRFNRVDCKWNERQLVETTTLDRAIHEFGVPNFVKIDVEGFEYEVLLGLSQPVSGISIEFATEFRENTYKCIDRLRSLSPIELNLSLGESMEFALPEWASATETKQFLKGMAPLNYGDIYIRSSTNSLEDASKQGRSR